MQEIQCLIGWVLWVGVDCCVFGECQIVIDCDVIQVDGGMCCVLIIGGWVVLCLVVNKLMKVGIVIIDLIMDYVVVVLCGIYVGQLLLDLDYVEDSEVGMDGNFIMIGVGCLIEIQMLVEGVIFLCFEMNQLLDLVEGGIVVLVVVQKVVI